MWDLKKNPNYSLKAWALKLTWHLKNSSGKQETFQQHLAMTSFNRSKRYINWIELSPLFGFPTYCLKVCNTKIHLSQDTYIHAAVYTYTRHTVLQRFWHLKRMRHWLFICLFAHTTACMRKPWIKRNYFVLYTSYSNIKMLIRRTHQIHLAGR